MPRLTRWMLPLFALSMGLSGCTQTTKAIVNSGSGFSMGNPLPATQAYMVNNDIKFAKWYLAHRKTCAAMTDCAK